MERQFKPVLGKRIRVRELTDCGAIAPSGLSVVTDGFITLNLSAEVEDATEIISKKADGSLCVSQMGNPSFKRFNLEAEFCGVHPSLLAAITNVQTYEDWNGDIAGIVVPEGVIDGRFSLELWTGLSGGACASGVEEASGYLLLPFVGSGNLGDIEIGGENAINFSLSGSFTRGGNQWGLGPVPVMQSSGSPALLPTALDPLDHLLLVETGLAPPPNSL